MRIISGSARSTPIQIPPGEVRPTSDRVREALFSILGEAVPGARCLDLFAGSGALGIEALSRGAESCLFVDSSGACCATIEANLKKTRLGGGKTRQVEVAAYLRVARGPFDLVFADPPYAKGDLPDLSAELAISPELFALLAQGATLVLESLKGAGEYRASDGLELIGLREYGDTQLAFYRRQNPNQ